MLPLQVEGYHLPGCMHPGIGAPGSQDRPALPADLPQSCLDDGLHRAADFVGAGHEQERVAVVLFDQPLQFAHGGPNGASTSLAYLVFDLMQQRYDYGRSTAAAFILLVIIAAATALQMKLDRTERDE